MNSEETMTENNCYSCKIIADSVNTANKSRLTTFEVTYPRFVHAELMTHRQFSRNSSSSRAIPQSKLVQKIVDNTAMPVFWGKNQRGMQAYEEMDLEDIEQSKKVWIEARDLMVEYSNKLSSLGVHKQICNRILEPWMPITVIVSSTTYSNFFHLRCAHDAQPEIKQIADMMKKEYENNTPEAVEIGSWHLPYATKKEKEEIDIEDLKRICTARCARVSYLTHDGKRDLSKDLELSYLLSDSGHWSPFEHIAQATCDSGMYGNFCGWKQYRKFFMNEVK